MVSAMTYGSDNETVINMIGSPSFSTDGFSVFTGEEMSRALQSLWLSSLQMLSYVCTETSK